MSETFERITAEQIDDQPGHVYRYQFAAGWLEDYRSVLDIACGIGYGAEVLARTVNVDYLGIDKIEPDERFRKFGRFVSGVDLDEYKLDRKFDVAICFETLEHLKNPQHLAGELMKNSQLVIVSVPTQPTKHLNEFHLHDFTVDDILEMFASCDLLELQAQPEEMSHVFVFKTSNA